MEANVYGLKVVESHGNLSNKAYNNGIGYSLSYGNKTYEYNANGINTESRYTEYEDLELSSYMAVTNMDTLSRQINLNQAFTNVKSDVIVSRANVDVAQVVCKEGNKVLYKGAVKLSDQYGIRRMELPQTGNAKNPYNFGNNVIYPMPQEEIDALIARENDPKVVEGLRTYIRNRDKFYYNSADDKDFVNEYPTAQNLDVSGVSC